MVFSLQPLLQIIVFITTTLSFSRLHLWSNYGLRNYSGWVYFLITFAEWYFLMSLVRRVSPPNAAKAVLEIQKLFLSFTPCAIFDRPGVAGAVLQPNKCIWSSAFDYSQGWFYIANSRLNQIKTIYWKILDGSISAWLVAVCSLFVTLTTILMLPWPFEDGDWWWTIGIVEYRWDILTRHFENIFWWDILMRHLMKPFLILHLLEFFLRHIDGWNWL